MISRTLVKNLLGGILCCCSFALCCHSWVTLFVEEAMKVQKVQLIFLCTNKRRHLRFPSNMTFLDISRKAMKNVSRAAFYSSECSTKAVLPISCLDDPRDDFWRREMWPIFQTYGRTIVGLQCLLGHGTVFVVVGRLVTQNVLFNIQKFFLDDEEFRSITEVSPNTHKTAFYFQLPIDLFKSLLTYNCRELSLALPNGPDVERY